MPYEPQPLTRRSLLRLASGGLASTVLASGISTTMAAVLDQQKQTEFQIACMTLPYSQFPLRRALTGIKSAGYDFVAWGTSHQEHSGGKPVPVLAADASPERAKDLAKQCRDLGLEPLMMFSTIYPEADNGLEGTPIASPSGRCRWRFASADLGHTEGGHRQLWIERFKQLQDRSRATMACCWSSNNMAVPRVRVRPAPRLFTR